MEPIRAGEELVGVFPFLEEIRERRELSWIFGTDVCSLADEMLRAGYTTDLAIHGFASEARINDDRAHDEPCRFQYLMTAVGQIHDCLDRWEVAWVLSEIKEFAQFKMLR